MYVPFPAVSACSKSQSNKHPTKRPIPARPTDSPPTPSHQRSVSLHGTPQRNSIRENFNSSNDPLHQIFPKTIPPKIFPGIFPKNFSGTHNDRPVRDFPKMPQRIFRQIPASHPYLMQPPLEPGYYIGRSGVPKRYPIPGSIRAPIPHFRIGFESSSGSGVHADRKYRFKWLFLQNTRFTQDLTLRFSGLSRYQILASGY